ncbi:hypothetical protein KKF84_08800, partial [Myxococcota bacterium]|nr:hypothetical protein [Myxococcota bacterium]
MKLRYTLILFTLLFASCEGESGVIDSNNGNNINNINNDAGHDVDATPPVCTTGVDNDHDGYGEGCELGPDCNDENPNIHPGAQEVCNTIDDNCNDLIDEGVLNACGNCSSQCRDTAIGLEPFPLEFEDPNVDTEGTGLDENGDVVLMEEQNNFAFLWTANTEDMGRGTVSKVDTKRVAEVGRYFSVTCFGRATPYLQDGTCLDINGLPIQLYTNNPSRTAVDFNFDMWVANRAFSGQASVTKIAAKKENCIDRNGDGIINTSEDLDGDGHINTDCDSDGIPDDIHTLCTNGLPSPEFYGLDDECVLLTTNYAATNQLGRSVCLDKGSQDIGASNVWVGTYSPSAGNAQSATNNVYYQLDGMTGQFISYVVLPDNIFPYGCAVDQDGMLWISAWGWTTFIDTVDPNHYVGPAMQVPAHYPSRDQMYGITIDNSNNVWFGGWGSGDIFRYRPLRTAYGSPNYYTDLASGAWTRIDYTAPTAGIAADIRGYIWAADNNN